MLRGKRTIFKATQGISVILHQPDQAGEPVRVAINAGATGTNGPNFYPSDPDLAYNKALLVAFDRAKPRPPRWPLAPEPSSAPR